MRIGDYALASPVLLAPMAGVTDRPFRQICRRFGVGLTPSEMISADPRLANTRKQQQRSDHIGEPEPRSVQIAGAEPGMLADAARANVDRGAQIIDINMGCPAKKVCNKAAGSALLKDEALVERILDAVVGAVAVPVTLKIRTGWDPSRRNGVRIARIAEHAGIAALAVHGRTRACGYRGSAEYETIRCIKQAVRIPVIANGDIDSPAAALAVRAATGTDAVMIGRAAQGRPWLPARIGQALAGAPVMPEPPLETVRDTVLDHLELLYNFYGEHGVRIARKHLAWYTADHPGAEAFRRVVCETADPEKQFMLTREHFDRLQQSQDEGLAA